MFTAREWDSESCLYYYRARMYHPTTGRFLQPDLIGYYDSMNLYQYCGNNPVNWRDPWGLMVGIVMTDEIAPRISVPLEAPPRTMPTEFTRPFEAIDRPGFRIPNETPGQQGIQPNTSSKLGLPGPPFPPTLSPGSEEPYPLGPRIPHPHLPDPHFHYDPSEDGKPGENGKNCPHGGGLGGFGWAGLGAWGPILGPILGY